MTTYRPVVTTDPCSGCPVTTMRPVTSFVQRAQLVPYTSYMPVTTPVVAGYAPSCGCSTCAAPTCSACSVNPGCSTCSTNYAPNYYGVATTSYYQPAIATTLPVRPSCGCSTGTTTNYAPAVGTNALPGYLSPGYSTSAYAPAVSAAPAYSAPVYNAPNYAPAMPSTMPANAQPSYGTQPYQGTAQPGYNGINSTIPPTPQPTITPPPGTTTQNSPPSSANATTQTFQSGATPAASSAIKPIRDPNLDDDGQQLHPPAPRINAPGDRTTSIPSARPWSCSLIRYERPVAEPIANADGWHAVP